MTALKKKKPVAKTATKTAKKSATKVKAAAKTAKKSTKVTAKVVKSVKKAPVKAVKKAVAVKTAPKAVKKPALAAKKTPSVVKAAVKAPAKIMKPVAKSAPVAMARPVVQTRTIQPGLRTAPQMGRPMSQMTRPGQPVVQRPANDTPMENFRAGDYVVYPAHGVGTIEGVETQSIAGMSVTLYAISFEKDRMRLKIPVQKAQTAGLRKLSTGDRLKDALKTLTGKAKIKRTMWSRRAQEYEAKINSGDPVQIAEVLRDLRRPKDDTEQSYSERQIYQSALERLAREVAAVEKIAEDKAVARLEDVLTKAA